MTDVCGAFVWLEVIEQCPDAPPRCLDGSLVGFADEGFELGEHHLDGVEIGAIRRQEQQAGPDLTDGLPGFLSLVASQIVEDDDVALCQRWDERLLEPGGIDRAVQNQRRHDAVVPQPSQEGQRLPMAVGNLGQIGLATRTPAAGPGHVGLHPGLIDEDQALWINPVLMSLPACPEPGQLRPILLLGHQRFF